MALTDNILGYWKLDETSGTNANDEVSTNDGTHTGVAVNETGILGKACKYVDNGDYTLFGAYSALWDDSKSTATFSFWFKADDVSAGNHITLAKSSNYSSDGRDRQFYINILSTGQVRVWIGDDGGANNYDYWTTNDNIVTSDNTWYHIATTLNLGSNTCVIYVNASSYASTLSSTGSNVSVFKVSSEQLKVGRLRNSDGTYAGMTNGYVDEIGIWDVVLDSTAIGQLYNSGAGLTYPFTTGTVIKDLIGGFGIIPFPR